DFAQHFGRALAVAADYDAIGKQEVGDGGAFAQKLGIGRDVEQLRVGTAAQDDLAHPLAGVDGNGTFLDDDLVVVDAPGNFAGHRFDVRQIGLSALGGGRAHGHKDYRTETDRFLQVVGKGQPLSAVADRKSVV